MPLDLILTLKPGVRLLEDRDRPTGLEQPGQRRLRLAAAGAGQEAFLRALAQGASTEPELCAGSMALQYLLAQLERAGWIGYALAQGGEALAILEPMSREFRFQVAAGAGPWRLSRFAWIRRLETEAGGAVLETPLGPARVLLPAPAAWAWLGRLGQPQTPEDLAAGTGLAPAQVSALLSMLVTVGAVAACAEDGRLPEDRDPALRQWEFHDLLFHSRSRAGWHGQPMGGTYRFLGDLDPLPALKPLAAETAVPLPEPGPPAPHPSFYQVVEDRRSRRVPGPDPITLAQLGTFLHYVSRIRAVLPADPGAGRAYEAVSGPCPGGGGLHEIELYLAVSRCAGLAPGFYHYAAGAHLLELCPGSSATSGRPLNATSERLLNPAAERLLIEARASMGEVPVPDILITLAARIQRVTWKYQTLAYALILKNVGVLYQQMYLVATAQGLAPCALGAGDSRLFAQASGLDCIQETSVGEFALSGSAPYNLIP